MAKLVIPAATFHHGELPFVCVKTGHRADRIVAVPATRTPRWTWWLLLFGVLPFQLARWLMRRQTMGWVPMCRSAAARLQWIRLLSCASLPLGGLSVILGGLLGSPCLVHLGALALATAVGATLVEPVWSVRARLDPSGNRVLLSRVHPAFLAAVTEGKELPGRRGRSAPSRPDQTSD